MDTHTEGWELTVGRQGDGRSGVRGRDGVRGQTCPISMPPPFSGRQCKESENSKFELSLLSPYKVIITKVGG